MRETSRELPISLMQVCSASIGIAVLGRALYNPESFPFLPDA